LNVAATSTWNVGAGNILAAAGGLDIGGNTLTKDGPGSLIIGGPQNHSTGAVLNILDGTVFLDSDAGIIAANLSISVTDAVLNLRANQHLDTLSIGEGGEVVFAGADVVVLNHLVIGGVDMGAMTLTPEPAALGLLALGALALVRRRKR
jgi:hypothetical protein